MKGNNILAALSYFSIFFAPILLPIALYIFGEAEVKYHAKKALWSHIIPTLVVMLGIIVTGGVQLVTEDFGSFGLGILFTIVIGSLVTAYYFIWNIVSGVKVLQRT